MASGANFQGREDSGGDQYLLPICSDLEKYPGDCHCQSRQFDFRDTVEPVYRELTELQLEQASKPTELELQKKQH